MKKHKGKRSGVRKLVLDPEIIADLTAVRAVAGGGDTLEREISASGCGGGPSNICQQDE
jgi:hypothetical protein